MKFDILGGIRIDIEDILGRGMVFDKEISVTGPIATRLQDVLRSIC